MDETLSYFCQSLKNSTFRGAGHEKPIQRGDCLKRGAWTVCKFKGGRTWQERGGGVVFFEGLIPQCKL